MMKALNQLALIATVAVILSGCSRFITGVYALSTNPSQRIEFLKSGKLLIQSTGDMADYTVDGNTVQVTHMVGGAIGKIDGDSITFSGNGIVADTLRGTWSKQK